MLSIRGRCQVCNRRRRVRKDGMVREHFKRELSDGKMRGPRCPGSSCPPRETSTGEWFCNTGCPGCRDAISYGV